MKMIYLNILLFLQKKKKLVILKNVPSISLNGLSLFSCIEDIGPIMN
jgi:hypothetical protein